MRRIYIFDNKLSNYVVYDVAEADVDSFFEQAYIGLKAQDETIKEKDLIVFQIKNWKKKEVALNRLDKLIKIKDQEKKIRDYIKRNKIKASSGALDDMVMNTVEAVSLEDEVNKIANDIENGKRRKGNNKKGGQAETQEDTN